MAVTCGVLFFLPWVQLSCTDRKTEERKLGYSQTGYQIAQGELTRSEDLDKFYKSMQRVRRVMDGQHATPRGQTNIDNEIEGYEQKCSGFPGLWAFPAGVVLIVLAGLVHMIAMPGARPTIPVIGVAACGLALGSCYFVDLPIEQQVDSRVPKRARAAPEYQRIKKEIELERMPAFNVAVGLTGGIGLLVFTHYGFAFWRRRRY